MPPSPSLPGAAMRDALIFVVHPAPVPAPTTPKTVEGDMVGETPAHLRLSVGDLRKIVEESKPYWHAKNGYQRERSRKEGAWALQALALRGAPDAENTAYFNGGAK